MSEQTRATSPETDEQIAILVRSFENVLATSPSYTPASRAGIADLFRISLTEFAARIRAETIAECIQVVDANRVFADRAEGYVIDQACNRVCENIKAAIAASLPKGAKEPTR